MAEVTVLIGAGSIGRAIARRTSAGRHVLVADLHQDNANAAAKTLDEAGFDTSTAVLDVSSRGSVHALALLTAVATPERVRFCESALKLNLAAASLA